MPRPRFFYSASSKDWISPLIVVSRGLVSVANCVPFPYVKTALSGGLALLELIEAVGKTTEELKYLAESVVTIMKLLREEIDAHPTNPNPKFHQICVEFNIHLDGLSKDIGIMAKDWSSSTFKKYVKTNGIRDEIAQFTRRVADLRADATLIAAVGTRMDLVEVANTVTAVQSSVSEIRNELAQIRSGSSRASLNDELVRFEEDVSDFSNLKDELSTMGSHVWFGARQFASVNAENGKLLMTHAELTTTDSISRMNTWKPEPFLEWFMSSPTLELDSVNDDPGVHARPSAATKASYLSAKCIVHVKSADPGTQLCPPTEPGWFPSRIPSVDGRADPGWTHFVVPLMKSHAWTSVLDYSLHRGYFLTAQITFSTNMGMPEAWIAQSGVFIPDHSQESDPSEFLIPIRTAVILMWEMVLCQEETGTTTGSLALLETIPSNIHVFLQVPTLDEGRIQEPRMYWSTDPLCIETSLIPPGMFKIRFGFGTNITLAWWEKHHYDAARSILEECGFDPRTIAAANSLNLPLFEPYHGPTITFPLSHLVSPWWTHI
ncbi:hypothetical protein B0H17DRAFT_1201377 [Mycena rosella]|uniref:Uncharacterized protein n=1 Tax=Mycena rosella TaxID=1033263 RepID=A0AAD7DGV4_MYCRO|nr:hypothetical protein B0H17DRAFT_1201377 [Mycena rosella]